MFGKKLGKNNLKTILVAVFFAILAGLAVLGFLAMADSNRKVVIDPGFSGKITIDPNLPNKLILDSVPLDVGLPVKEGLVLHLDANAIEGLEDNDPVAQWDDLSGEGNHATQGTAGDRPTYKTNIINGKPVIRFNGDGEYLLPPNLGIGQFTQNFTFFIVFRPISLPAQNNWQTNPPIYSFRESEGRNVMFVFGDGGSPDSLGIRAELSSSGWTSIVDSEDIEEEEVDLITINFNTSSGWNIFQKGDEVDNNSNTETSRTGSESGGIGGTAGGSNRWHEGDVAEIVVYDTNLSTQEREQVEQYLGKKWLGW